MEFFKRKHFIISGIITLIFIIITQMVPYMLIAGHVIYDKTGIMMKAEAIANMLCWPFSFLFSSGFVFSYFFIPLVYIYYLVFISGLTWLHIFLKRRKLYKWVLPAVMIPFVILRISPNMLVACDNDQPSRSIGRSDDGKLMNGKRLPFRGENFQFFNFISYIKGNCFLHDKVRKSILEAYKTCETTCPGIQFSTGEGSKKHGGVYVFNHRTHQNGTSIDLQLVFNKNGKQYDPLSLLNAYGYGLETDSKGTINQSIPVNFYPENTSIDFETNARYLLALDDACRKNGIKIRIVIFKVELRQALFATTSGKKLLARHIRFAHVLPELVNRAHDDHFHVDFDVSQ